MSEPNLQRLNVLGKVVFGFLLLAILTALYEAFFARGYFWRFPFGSYTPRAYLGKFIAFPFIAIVILYLFEVGPKLFEKSSDSVRDPLNIRGKLK